MPIAESSSLASTSDDEEDDELPAVGKVWEDTGGPSLSELLKQQEASAPPSVVAANVPERATVSDVEPVAACDLEALYDKLVGQLEAKSASLPALLSGAKLVGIEDGTAILRYPHDHISVVRMLDRNGKKDAIRDALSQLLNRSVGLKLELDASIPAAPVEAVETAIADKPATSGRPPVRVTIPEPPPPMPAAPSIRITDELRAQLREDPLIRAVIETLGGEIVKVE